jgi:type IV pilus assembly protein PilW
MQAHLQKTDGFTLLELLVAMGLGLTMMGAIATTYMSQTKVYAAQEQINEMEQNARGALDVITRELKMAGYKPAAGTITGITHSTSQLQIEADIDANGTIDNTSNTTVERIIFAFDSGNKRITRKLGSGGTVQAVADNVTAFSFDYLDSNGGTASTSATVRQVRVNITAKTARPDPNYSSNSGYRTITMTATVTPPNLAL